ncbi:MAG: SPASM domain-containing protein [Nitrospirae bacterium]|nr:SPASM domain-containing protein [Nitrospirota bacterium]
MYSPLRHMDSIFRKSKPIHLTFFVTKRCNSKCPFCFYLKSKEGTDTKEFISKAPSPSPSPSGGEGTDSPLLRGVQGCVSPPLRGGDEGEGDLCGSTNDRINKYGELSLDEIEKISCSMGNLLWLAFSGGEIYLRDDLLEISKIFYKNNKPAIMLYPTNGLLPELIKDRTEQILNHCKKSVIAVKLSIDGLYGSHDAIRNTQGSFDKTMQTYHMLEGFYKYPNFELGVNTVFCSENQDSMDGIIDFVRGLKNIKTHTISLVRGNLTDGNYKKVDHNKYLHAIARLEENLKSRVSSIYRFKGARIKAAQDILQRLLIHRTMLEQRRLIPCYAGRLNLVLSESGDVYPCEILTESFGNVRDYEYDIKKIIRDEKARKIVGSITNNQCFCTHECYFMTNILFNPGLYPTLFKEYMQLRFC